jgi:SAM-dependent methyltransferase
MSAICPICGSGETRFAFNGFTNRDPSDRKVWPVYECVKCGHAWIHPQPSAEELSHYYSASYEAYDEKHGAVAGDTEVIEKAWADGEFRHIPIPAGKRVLDFGCGGGYFLNICRQLGATVEGIELSPHGAALTRKQGISVFQGTIEQFLAARGDQRFDVITSFHVLEHVPDPVATLEGLSSLLTSDGTMTIAVPNATSVSARRVRTEWHSTDLPFHIHQFSPSSLRAAAERAGLRIRELRTTSIPGATAASFQLFLRRRFLIPWKVSRYLPLKLIGRRMARRHDSRNGGEAILACFDLGEALSKPLTSSRE